MSEQIYLLQLGNGQPFQVSRAEWIAAERAAGFHGPARQPATHGFTSVDGHIRGTLGTGTDAPATPDLWVMQRRPVAAIQWTGSNFAEVETFAADWIGDPEAIGLRNAVDDGGELGYTVNRAGQVVKVVYNVVQFTAWGDDQEVDAGSWIVVWTDVPDMTEDRGHVMDDEDFHGMFEQAPRRTPDSARGAGAPCGNPGPHGQHEWYNGPFREECRGRLQVITLCGSTRFKDEIHAVNARLTAAGNVVISMGMFGHTDHPDQDWTTGGSTLKVTLDRIHLQKIDMADQVYVVNPGGYIGESTRNEIAYAHARGVPVHYLVDLEDPNG